MRTTNNFTNSGRIDSITMGGDVTQTFSYGHDGKMSSTTRVFGGGKNDTTNKLTVKEGGKIGVAIQGGGEQTTNEVNVDGELDTLVQASEDTTIYHEDDSNPLWNFIGTFFGSKSPEHTPETQRYLDFLTMQKKQISEMIKDLGKLSKEEEELLEDFKDSLTEKVCNKPVLIFGFLYDLDSLPKTTLQGGSYTKSDIRPAWEEYKKAKDAIDTIIFNREYKYTLK